jgi:hypothetical protein
MQKKLCSECGSEAEVSLCQIISTVGRSPRKQRCGVAVAFCGPCLQGRVKLLRRSGLLGIQKPLSEAFTALAGECGLRLSRARRSAAQLPVPNAADRAGLQALSNSLQLTSR